MVYVIDIDGTICSITNGEYLKATPFHDRIKQINALHDAGHTIIYHTARGMGRSKNLIAMAQCLFTDLTRKQLDDWGAKYHQLFLGKPSGDFYIDDKGIKDKDFFADKVCS